MSKNNLVLSKSDPFDNFAIGGLFLDPIDVPNAFVSYFASKNLCSLSCSYKECENAVVSSTRKRFGYGGGFLSVSLSVNNGDGGYVGDSGEVVGQNGNSGSEELVLCGKEQEKKKKDSGGMRSGAFNTTKHLWAGAFAAMVARTCVAPLERLKMEYLVRGEQKDLFELIKSIAASQGLIGFWKGNILNILRTAPFKAINFVAYDTYRCQLMRLTKHEESTNFERFVAGAAAGITATILCLPMDTIRTIILAPGGEAFGGLIGAFRHTIQTEGFLSLYKGLLPSVVAMAPSGAVYYGVYDILKAAYLHSPEGRKRIQRMKEQGQDLSAVDQMELGPMKTLLYGAIAGACAEAATYPFEVVRRHLQLQCSATKLGALATCAKIVEHGGVPALYAGVIPSLLQVLPSSAISFLVYEFMKVVLKVESL